MILKFSLYTYHFDILVSNRKYLLGWITYDIENKTLTKNPEWGKK